MITISFQNSNYKVMVKFYIPIFSLFLILCSSFTSFGVRLQDNIHPELRPLDEQTINQSRSLPETNKLLSGNFSAHEFVTTWKTDNNGTTEDNQIRIPTNPNYTYNYTVNWGDGTTTSVNGDALHTYENPGTYTVSITGDFPAIYFNFSGDRSKLLSVDQWGDIVWQSFALSFYGCNNLVIPATDRPNLSQVTDMFAAFANCLNLNSPSISNWDVSNIQDMGGAFFNCLIFNQDLSGWNTTNLSSIDLMFVDASNFNQDLSSWNISNLGSMFNAFDNSGLSTLNYDNMLNGWATQTVQPTVTIGVEGLTYCDGDVARASLIEDGWNFVGDSKECLPFAQYTFAGNAEDITNNGYDGTVNNLQLSKDRFSVPENAYQFSQNQGRIDLQNTVGDVNLSENFTVSAWINPSQFESEAAIVANHDETAGFGFVLADFDNTIPNQLKVEFFDNNASNVFNGGIVNANQWNHVVMAYSPTTGVSIYVNGQLTSQNNVTLPFDLSQSTAPISIGNHDFYGTFKGLIDDVSLYPNYLSQDDVTELYQTGNWPLVLTAQYNFSGDASDVTGNGFDGTVNGAVLAQDRFNQPDRAYDFTNGSIVVDSLPVPQNLTISSWFKTNNDYANGFRSIIDMRGSSALSIGTNNQLEAVLRITQDDFLMLNTDFPVNDDQWHLATLTFDGESFSLYLDDNLVNSRTNLSDPLYSDSDSALFNIGLTTVDNNTSFFNGLIDDIKYYDYALNEFQVKELFNVGGFVAKPSSGPLNPNLLALADSYMRFNFESAAEEVTGYIAVRSRTDFVSDDFLQDGNTYTNYENNNSTDSYVIYPDVNDTTITDFNANFPLNPETEYFYKVWSYNGEGSNRKYSNGQTLAFSRSTTSIPPTDLAKNLQVSEVTQTSMKIDFIASEDPQVSGYLVLNAQINNDTEPTFGNSILSGNTFNVGDNIGDYKVISTGTSLSAEIMGLTPASRQNIYVYTYAGSGNTSFYSYSLRNALYLTLANEPAITPNNFESSSLSSSGYTVSFDGFQDAEPNYDSLFIVEKENTEFLTSLYFIGIASNYDPVVMGEYADNNSVEIRFGPGLSQKAHRFLVPEGATGGVANLNYQYQDYVEVPFEVWDIDRNIQLNVSFRDQGRDGKFNLIEFDLSGAAIDQSREFLFINDTEYNPDTPDENIAINGGHLYRLKYQNWIHLTDGFTWDENNLPESVIRYAHYNKNNRGYLVVKNGAEAPVDGEVYNEGDLIGDGRIIYIGNESTFTEDNLAEATESQYSIYPYQGAGLFSNYSQSNVLEGSASTLVKEPLTQPTEPSFSDVLINSFVLSFTPAEDNPDGYIIVMSEEAIPESLPQDGVSYTRGQFLDVEESDRIVYVGNENSIPINDLTFATEYHFAVYSYNGENELTNYNLINPLTASQFTSQDNSAPEFVDISYPSEVELEGEFEVQLEVRDPESDITSVQIQYIKSNEGNYDNATVADMTTSENLYVFTISDVGVEGIEFKILAENSIGLVAETESYPIITRISEEGLTVPYNAFGTEQSNYRIISVPLELNNKSINSVFSQQLGDYGDKSKWRMFRYGAGSTSELSGNTSLDPGNGYWLIANAVDASFSTGEGVIVNASIDNPFEIELKPGWNQIGNPYTFNVSWDNILVYNNQDLELKIFDGNWKNSNSLVAFSGGFVFWPNDDDFILKIPKGSPSASQNRQLNDQGNSQGWILPLTLYVDDQVNNFSGIGMNENASDEIDSHDSFNLPRFMDYVELNHQNQLYDYALSTDIVELKENHTWTFDLNSNAENSNVVMKWEEISALDHFKSKKLVLLDPIRNAVIDMKQLNSYAFKGNTINGVKVIFGDETYINNELQIGQVQFYDPYPNPSNSIFTIGYFIPESQKGTSLQFDIIDSKGKKISQKYYQNINSGLYQVEWDLNDEIKNISAGLYFINMTVNQEIQAQKKLLIKN